MVMIHHGMRKRHEKTRGKRQRPKRQAGGGQEKGVRPYAWTVFRESQAEVIRPGQLGNCGRSPRPQ
jgi:hypothetical protein